MAHRSRPFAAVLLVVASLVPAATAAAGEWPAPPAGLLQQARCTVDPEADSEISQLRIEDWHLLNDLGPGFRRSFFEQVKVFDERGARRWARIDVRVPYEKSRQPDIVDLEARTLLPDGTVLDATFPSPQSQVAFDEFGRRVTQWSFAPRGVAPGCVLQLRWRIDAPGLLNSTYYVPLQFAVPLRDLRLEVRPVRDTPFYYSAIRCAPGVKLDDHHNLYTFTLHDQPALAGEPDAPPEALVRAAVVLFYSSANNKEPAEYWLDLGHTLATLFDSRTVPDRAARRLFEDSLATSAGPVAQLERLVTFCRTRLRRVDRDVDSLAAARARGDSDGAEVLRLRRGTDFGVTYALGALCRTAGFETRLLRVARQDEWPFRQESLNGGFLPAPAIAVRFGGQWLPLSAVAPREDWDMLPWPEEGNYALLCDRDSTCFITTPIGAAGQSAIERRGDLELRADGTLEGEWRLRFTGHWNERVRSDLDDGAMSLREALGERGLLGTADCEVSAVEAENLASDWEPLRVRAHVRVTNHAVPGERRTVVEPAVMRAHEPARYTAPKRTLEVSYDFAWAEFDSVRVRPMVGARWEPPPAIAPIDAGPLGSYRAACAVGADGALTWTRTLLVAPSGTLAFPADAYPTIRRYFETVRARDGVTVTLTTAP